MALLDQLETDPAPVLAREPNVLEALVTGCVRVKAQAVAEDERDTGARLILNYGHTLGHALERLEAFGGRSHGEAIAIGMVFAARLSRAARPRTAGSRLAHGAAALVLGLETDGSLPPVDDILAAFRLDKKYHGGVRFVLLRDVGDAVVVDDVPEAQVREVLEAMGG